MKKMLASKNMIPKTEILKKSVRIGSEALASGGSG